MGVTFFCDSFAILLVKWYSVFASEERDRMRFYINKIGGHLQELAVLAAVFVPLDRNLTSHERLMLWGFCGAIITVGIEMERRTR